MPLILTDLHTKIIKSGKQQLLVKTELGTFVPF